ncbi:MAG: DUF7701 domain-containing protein [Thermoleophilaceae bacterium]
MNYVETVRKQFNRECSGLDPALVNLYVLLVLVKGPDCTLEDVHDAWAVWRNINWPDHPSLIPFPKLSVDIQELDRKYVTAIHNTTIFIHDW